MPIQFRCFKCEGLLSIARRKAGTVVQCPKCFQQLVVPEDASAPAVRKPEAVAANQSGSRSSPGLEQPNPGAKEKVKPGGSTGDRPLFEQLDLDELLGPRAKPANGTAPTRAAQPVVYSLDDEPDVELVPETRRSKGRLLLIGFIVILFAGVAVGMFLAKK
jgi:phage FluMu protein Com